jgi:hypothetical protein
MFDENDGGCQILPRMRHESGERRQLRKLWIKIAAQYVFLSAVRRPSQPVK